MSYKIQYINKDGDRWINQKQLIDLLKSLVPKGKLIDPGKVAEWLESSSVEGGTT